MPCQQLDHSEPSLGHNAAPKTKKAQLSRRALQFLAVCSGRFLKRALGNSVP
jgi:hypothetical protein